jgi:Tol biopolymer transport system component
MTRQGREPNAHLFAVNPDGKDLKRVGDVEAIMPAVSPDGKQILYTAVKDRPALCVMKADGTGARKVHDNALSGAWSPDGKRIAYVADAGGGRLALHVSAADGSGAVRLTKTRDMVFGPQWSADGKRIYFTRMPLSGPGGQAGVYAIDPDGKNERRLSPEGSMDLLGGAVLLLGRRAEATFKEVENKIGK